MSSILRKFCSRSTKRQKNSRLRAVALRLDIKTLWLRNKLQIPFSKFFQNFMITEPLREIILLSLLIAYIHKLNSLHQPHSYCNGDASHNLLDY